MSGDIEDFVRLVLLGKRDFAGIQLKGNDLSGHPSFNRLQQYLKEQYLRLSDNPIILSKANLKGLKANGLYFPFVIARGADLEGACLCDANLRSANLEGANLKGANLYRARMGGAYLHGANLDSAYLMQTDLWYAYLVGVKKLKKSRMLEKALFGRTRVDAKEERIIRKAWRNNTPFVRTRHCVETSDHMYADDARTYQKTPLEEQMQHEEHKERQPIIVQLEIHVQEPELELAIH